MEPCGSKQPQINQQLTQASFTCGNAGARCVPLLPSSLLQISSHFLNQLWQKPEPTKIYKSDLFRIEQCN